MSSPAASSAGEIEFSLVGTRTAEGRTFLHVRDVHGTEHCIEVDRSSDAAAMDFYDALKRSKGKHGAKNYAAVAARRWLRGKSQGRGLKFTTP